MAIEYKLKKQLMNIGKNKGKTMYYAKKTRSKRLSFDDLCRRMSHGTIMEEADIHAVLIKLYEEIVEYTSEGYIVDCGKLGTFYASFGSEGVEKEEDFRPLKHMRPPKLRYRAKRGYDYLKSTTYIRIQEKDCADTCSAPQNGSSSNPDSNGGNDDQGGATSTDDL